MGKSSKTILIADADEQTASMISSTLESRAHSIKRTSDGHAAIDYCKQQSFDMVVVGEQLSDIDGIGFIAKLKSACQGAKIVFISNQWRAAEIYQLLTKEYGVALVVHRPIKPLFLGAQLDGLLNQSSIDLNVGQELERQAVAAMSERFREGLPGRMAVLSDLVVLGREQPNNVAFVKEAQRLAHNLKGTSGTCGMSDLAGAALRLEKFLALAHQDGTVKPGTWDKAGELFDSLHLCAEAVVHNTAPAVRPSNTALATDTSSATPISVTQSCDESAMAKVLFIGSGDNGDEHEHQRSLASGNFPIKIIASSAAEAVEKASHTALDAVLIDINFHDDESATADLAREIRGTTGNESLPLGFITQSAHLPDRITAAHTGASLFLNSPLEPDALKDGIEYLLAVRQGGRPRVLIVDDDPDFATLIIETLGHEGMLVRYVSDPTVVMQAMEAFVPDLVLLDVMMPTVSGFEVCRLLRAAPRWQDTPILFLTGETELDARLAAFDAGGDDYLPKPVATVELLTRVKVRLDRARLLRERADKDMLTGLLLRRAFMEQAKSLIGEAVRHGLAFTIALLDVDKFKSINDTYGHLAGDRVLAHFGQLLKRRFRVEDIRGRWGGEEFIVALRHESQRTTEGALARFLEELRGVRFEGDHGEKFGVTFTAGLATFPDDGDTLEALVKVADERLYAGKEAGRDRIVVANRAS